MTERLLRETSRSRTKELKRDASADLALVPKNLSFFKAKEGEEVSMLLADHVEGGASGFKRYDLLLYRQ